MADLEESPHEALNDPRHSLKQRARKGSRKSRSKNKHGKSARVQEVCGQSRPVCWLPVVLGWIIGAPLCRGAVRGSANVLATDVANSDLLIFLALYTLTATWMVYEIGLACEEVAVTKKKRRAERDDAESIATSLVSSLGEYTRWHKRAWAERERRRSQHNQIRFLVRQYGQDMMCESLADRAMEVKKLQVATQAANALANMQESEDFDAYDEDQDSQEVDNDIHAAAEGNGEYGGIHEGEQDDVIEALFALSDS